MSRINRTGLAIILSVLYCMLVGSIELLAEILDKKPPFPAIVFLFLIYVMGISLFVNDPPE